jgi:hypothetical protein
MKRFDASQIFQGLCLTAGLALVFVAAPTLADNPGAIANADEPAYASFTKFAQSWMDKVQRMAAEQKPSIRPGAANTMVTYRDYGDEFTVELRPTGHPTAPYVGILRYQEQIFSCQDITTNDCSLSSQIPVTEIFRYQGGRWIY